MNVMTEKYSRDEIKKNALKIDNQNSIYEKTGESLVNQLDIEDKLSFSDILFALTHVRFEETKSAYLWTQIVQHRRVLSSILNRDIGLVVATLDYLYNISEDISNPLIIEDENLAGVAEIAIKDELTELYDRTVFNTMLDNENKQSERYHKLFSLLMIDIDDFKLINDTYGHQFGDNVLKSVAKQILKTIRESDIAARYGGEEFIILLPNTSAEKAGKLAEKIRQQIANIRFKSDVSITVSIGVAGKRNGDTLEKMIKNTDIALYEAKSRGKNTFVIYDEE